MPDAFRPTDDLIEFEITLFGPSGSAKAWVALDTGATVTLIDPRILLKIGINPFASTKSRTTITFSGPETVPSIEVIRLEALGVASEKFEVISHELPKTAKLDGLLGLNFFRGRRLTIDFAQGSIELGE